ncbi:MAG: hypothetical protein ACXWMI_07560 [Syntrophales bacterium]
MKVRSEIRRDDGKGGKIKVQQINLSLCFPQSKRKKCPIFLKEDIDMTKKERKKGKQEGKEVRKKAHKDVEFIFQAPGAIEVYIADEFNSLDT